MAAGNFILYDEYKRHQFISKLDLEADAIKCWMGTASYSPLVASHTTYSDLTNEVSHASYTTGGVAVGSPSVTEISAPSGDWKFTSSNVAQAFASTNSPAIKTAVFYFTGTIDSIVAPLIGYFELESGSTVTVLAGNTLTLQTPANGWFRWNGARS